ncbi:hypothetical protein DDZ13_09235 [Coraliomargarita sinensis]|uniref:TonB C-terminal domain-containing protein n=2 Tax=Coraliomargarita sinensis TaxID=2174842 RepID=A0A317ZEM6_9BACT|nr:hypothetical protein DDZ13_09235 [Coraliomargarita sinensis]
MVAFGITLMVHLFVVLAIPERMLPVHRETREKEAVIYEIDLAEPEDMRYVEANPEVPENEPDRTEQYSFRAQQAADESPLTESSNQPKVDGEVDSLKVVQGQLQQTPPVPPGVYSPRAKPGEGEGVEGGRQGAESQQQVAPAQPLPAPDFIRQKPVDEEGPGSSVDLTADAQKVFEQPEPDASINVYRPPAQVNPQVQPGDGDGGAVEARPMPRERPRLAPELITGPLLKSKSSVSKRGDLAIDATFSEFGEYEQQFYAAIQTGWYQEIEFFQPIDTSTRVHVRFRLKADGKVDKVEAVKSTASKIATVICETAISKRSPFRPWTEEMVKVFGKERWINVVFNYR